MTRLSTDVVVWNFLYGWPFELGKWYVSIAVSSKLACVALSDTQSRLIGTCSRILVLFFAQLLGACF